MKIWITALFVTAISGCGTIKTIHDEEGASDDLAKWQSHCSSIPRAYSGASYQFCNLDGPARSGSHWGAPVIVVDMVASGIADTIVFPYTGYQQYRYGDIQVRRKYY